MRQASAERPIRRRGGARVAYFGGRQTGAAFTFDDAWGSLAAAELWLAAARGLKRTRTRTRRRGGGRQLLYAYNAMRRTAAPIGGARINIPARRGAEHLRGPVALATCLTCDTLHVAAGGKCAFVTYM